MVQPRLTQQPLTGIGLGVRPRKACRFSFALSLFLYQIHLRDLVDSWLQADVSCSLAYTQEAASALVINPGEGLKPCADL